MSSRYLSLVVAVTAAVVGLMVASLWFAPKTRQITSGTLLPQPRAISDFTLNGDDGQPYTKVRLLGHWSLVFPGYTHCPDVCPTTLALLKALETRLNASGKNIQVIFLSVDPARDHPEQLASYVHYFDPTFSGVTAPEPELGRFTQELGVAYAKVPGPTAESYAMDHSAALVLINPQAQIAGYLTPPFVIETLSADLATLLEST